MCPQPDEDGGGSATPSSACVDGRPLQTALNGPPPHTAPATASTTLQSSPSIPTSLDMADGEVASTGTPAAAAPAAAAAAAALASRSGGSAAGAGGAAHVTGAADSFDASFVRDHLGRAKYSIHEVLRQLGAHEGQFLTMVVMVSPAGVAGGGRGGVGEQRAEWIWVGIRMGRGGELGFWFGGKFNGWG